MSVVLVVEDEELVCATICEGLEAEGYEVLTAADADRAIEMLESRVDIATVLTDIEIPGSMNGLRLATAIRDRWPPVNVVMTSGKLRPGAAQMPNNTRFVRKPFQTADLVRAFHSFG